VCGRTRFRLGLAALALLGVVIGLSSDAANAQTSAPGWPTKPVRIVVPWPAGGSADMIGRIAAEHLTQVFGQSFFVENRPGASGMVGSAAVAHAEPDGTTLVVSGIPSHVIAPVTSANPAFDPLKDFTHIAYVGGAPIVVTAHRSLGVSSIRDLIALARTSPGALGYVSPGVGSLGHMVGEYLARRESIRLKHVPYKGGAQAMTDLVAGHVKVGVVAFTTTAPHIRAGTLAALAVSSARRLPQYPELPTLKELGYDELVTTTWWSFSGPARLPPDVVTRLNRELNALFDSPAVRRKLAQDMIDPETTSPDELTRFVASEIRKWGPIAKAAISTQESRNPGSGN
jgi:tripartite-type tricarboxylate transporter receptor subunit TctC